MSQVVVHVSWWREAGEPASVAEAGVAVLTPKNMDATTRKAVLRALRDHLNESDLTDPDAPVEQAALDLEGSSNGKQPEPAGAAADGTRTRTRTRTGTGTAG